MQKTEGRSKKIEYHKAQKNEMITQKKKILSIKNLIHDNKLSKALSAVDEYLKEYPNDSYGLFQHAEILFVAEDYENAKKEFQYIVDNELESKYSATYKLALIARTEGNYETAYQLLLKNVEESPYPELFSVTELSSIELERGNINKALQILENYADLNNDNIILQYILTLQAQGKLEQAYQMIINHDFSNTPQIERDYCITKAGIESDLLMFDEAEKTYEQALKGPKTKLYYKSLINYAYLNLARGYCDEAITQCQEVLANGYSQLKSDAAIMIGHAYKRLNKPQQAEEAYLESLKYKDKGEVKGYLCLGDFKMVSKEYDEALRYFYAYLKNSKNPKSKAIGRLRMALVYMKKDDIENSKKYLSKVAKSKLGKDDRREYNHMMVHLNYLEGKNIDDSFYFASQYLDYSIDKLIEYINQQNELSDKKIAYNPEISLEQLILEASDLIENEPLIKNGYCEHYQIHYDNVGSINNQPSNTLQVIVFPNTKKILSLLPIIDPNNSMKKSNQKVKTQIEKFNQRYQNRSDV